MEKIFKIAKYKTINGQFIKTGYDEYTVTCLKGIKKYHIRIVINGYLTKVKITLTTFNPSYKKQILLAIKEYLECSNSTEIRVKMKLTIKQMKEIYNKNCMINFRNYFLTINKEESRDILTEYNLI